jgi:assimilatory nitrate reductase catalytic subunit
VVTAFSQGVNQSSAGVDKGNSIINCHLYTGRLGRPGMGPFSITGQPNAMGGREVGGLANLLAAHLDLAEPAHRELVRSFWNSPVIAERAGLRAVELFDAIHAGRVKAVWIMATNPVVSLPDANRVREALARCEFVAVSEVARQTDTSRYAHVLLPAAAWGEKDGTVTNSERRISRQRAFLPPAGEAKPDWWILTRVARRMGWTEAFPYESAHEVFLEHAMLSAHRNVEGDVPRDFNLAGLAELSREAYDALEPVQWPVAPGGRGTERLFGDGRFFHADGKARLVTVIPRGPMNRPDDEFPLVLNTGRVRDQWHTMTRTGIAPTLANHTPEPCAELHPRDALAFGLRDGGFARLATRWGACVLRVKADPGVARGQVFVPIHWNAQTASDAGIGALVNPVVDPLSGQPELKHTPVRAEPFEVDWQGFAIVRPEARVDPRELAWWTRVQGEGVVRVEFAGRGRPVDWSRWAGRLLGDGAREDWIEAIDSAAGMLRAAAFDDDRLEACVYVSLRRDSLPARAWLESRFAGRIDARSRVAILAGRSPEGGADPGPTVCSCFGVGRNVILAAVREKGCDTPEKLGAALGCGTNCGSCVPELRGLIAVASSPA